MQDKKLSPPSLALKSILCASLASINSAAFAQGNQEQSGADLAAALFDQRDPFFVYAYNDETYITLRNDIDGKLVITEMLDELSLCVFREGRRITEKIELQAFAEALSRELQARFKSAMPKNSRLEIVDQKYSCGRANFQIFSRSSFVATRPPKLSPQEGANHYLVTYLTPSALYQTYRIASIDDRRNASFQTEVRERLRSDTQSGTSDRLYSLTVMEDEKVRDRKLSGIPLNKSRSFWSDVKYDGEGHTCTVSYDPARAEISSMQSRLIISEINKNFGIPDKYKQGFRIFYRSVNEAFLNFDKRELRFKSPSGTPFSYDGCKTFIGFASDAHALLDALSRASVPVKVGAYEVAETVARTEGFINADEFNFAQKISASASELETLKQYGIQNTEQFNALIQEIIIAKYAKNPSPGIAIRYLADKRLGVEQGISALQVKNKRDSQYAAAEVAAKREFEACLARNGYTNTRNAAQKAAIQRQCRK